MTDKIASTENVDAKNHYPGSSDILNNVEYICRSTQLITDALRNGCDIAQLPNGDVMVTETKVVHMHYVWNKDKGKMVRLS
jgi:hypothetical protein